MGFLQSAGNSNNSTTTCAATFTTANLSAGSTLIAAAVTASAATASVTGVADAAARAFLKIATVTSAANSVNLTLWALNTPAGDVGTKPAITATATTTGSLSMALLVQEVSGIITSATAAGFTDGTAGTSTGTASGSIGPPSYASSVPGEYVVYLYGDDGPGITWTVPGGYTGDTHGVNASGNNDVQIAYKDSSGTTETGAYSLTGGANWDLILVAFKLTAPAGSDSGPDYAGAAADLGGGSGAWASPGNAGGAPDAAYATWTIP